MVDKVQLCYVILVHPVAPEGYVRLNSVSNTAGESWLVVAYESSAQQKWKNGDVFV